MSTVGALQMVFFCFCIASLFRRAFFGPQRVFAITILCGLGLSSLLLTLTIFYLELWLYRIFQVVWYGSQFLWLLMLVVHFHYLVTRRQRPAKQISEDKENGMAGTNQSRPGAEENLPTPLRNLIKTDARVAARVNAIIDIVPCGLADLEDYRRHGITLEAIETFVKKNQRMPTDVEEIRQELK